MKLRRIVVAVAAVSVVLFSAWAIFRSPMPDINPRTANELAAVADPWCEQLPDQIVPSDQWPTAVRQLDPQAVHVTTDGVYIVRGSWFVTEWGVFILRSGSTFQPSAGTDPSYCLLRGQVYWYEVKG